ncbi:MAG: hypothetical protein ACYTEV_11720 [Planctomycetota bacterium]
MWTRPSPPPPAEPLMLEPSDFAGIVGSGLIISTYAMSQAGRW